MVLVHGYNVKTANWGPRYNLELQMDRAPGFVIPIGYGMEDDGMINRTWELKPLVQWLSAELRSRMEDPGKRPAVLNQWAWTRYDAVGHSQGGVLLRLLCSQGGLDPWKHVGNYQRGRFHRVVTIGSPHAGSTIAHLAMRMEDRGVGLPQFAKLLGIDAFKKLLQKKFTIDNGGPNRPATVQQVNRQFPCDPSARIHALGTTIADSALAYSRLAIDNASRTQWLISA